jgi:P27 family predicted phage terminase small subunit
MAERPKAIWVETTGALESMGVLDSAHRHLIAAYCEAVATAEKSTEMINRTSLMVKGSRNNLVANKFLGIRRDALSQALKLAQEFGLTPAARTRIEVGTSFPHSKGPNPFAGNI